MMNNNEVKVIEDQILTYMDELIEETFDKIESCDMVTRRQELFNCLFTLLHSYLDMQFYFELIKEGE